MKLITDIGYLEKVLDEFLPIQNKKSIEPYDDLLLDLRHFQIVGIQDLRFLLEKHKEQILEMDTYRVNEIRSSVHEIDWDFFGSTVERIQNGVFYGHVGLTREAMAFEFEDIWMDYLKGKMN